MSSGWFEQRLFDVDKIPLSPPARAKRPRTRRSVEDAREFGGWTLNKLEVLRLYLRMYRRVAGSGTYIDAFAGDGTVRIGGRLMPGSAQIALEAQAFKALHLCELPDVAALLRTNLQSHRNWDRCQLHAGDANVVVPDLLDHGLIDPDRPLFALLDPDSTQLNWSTVEALASYKAYKPEESLCKAELWILFNLEQAIRRLWPNEKGTLPPHPTVLDRVMGGRNAWQDLWDARQGSAHLVARYCDQLADLGYVYVYPQQIIDPASGRPQYWMIHATDHPAAESFMRWAKRTSAPSLRVELTGVDWPDPPGARRPRG